MKKNARATTPTTPTVRCAIYTRKSTEEGLDQDFNSLDAQRDAGENYVRSLAGEGWACLPDRYDDGGFTGGNMDRPALRRLIADIEQGKVNCVVVYKVDRLSRSLIDFSRLIQTFDQHQVAFVSVTQQFNTANSMGRLMLNVLLSFAQFEREIISERTRDKIAATRRKGKWAGGWPILGYDVDPQGRKLRVNEDEAKRVRTIFDLYLQHGSLLQVTQELEQRGWQNKRWETRKGGERGGKAFTRTSLYKLLTNVAYAGKVRYKDEVHPGEHTGLVDTTVWQRAQSLLSRNGRTGGAPVRNKFGALLKGLIRCVPCECAMTPSHSTRGHVRYRYYVCSSAQKRGWHSCPSKSIPATQIEDLVVGQIKAIGRDPTMLQAVLEQARQQDQAQVAELVAERQSIERELRAWHAEMQSISGCIKPGDDNETLITRLAELQDRIGTGEEQSLKIQQRIDAIQNQRLSDEEAAKAMAVFEPVWATLTPHEHARVIQLLVEQVDYDGSKGKVGIAFRASGIKTLANQHGGN